MVADEGSSPSHPKPVPSKELTTRILSALVMVAAALLTAYLGGWAFALFWLAAGIATMVEWTDMTRIEPRRLVQAILGLGLAALTLLFLLDAGFWVSLAVGLAFLAAGAFAASGAQKRVWAASSFVYAAPI